MYVRSVLLKKYIKSSGDQEYDNIPGDYQKWLALGHYDEIFTFKDLLKNGFKSIKEKNDDFIKQINDNVCYHPLYLIVPKLDRKEKEFWDTEKWHIAITRIHFTNSRDPFTCFQELKGKLSKNSKPGCKFYCYYTTELSDMILVQKSNSFNLLLEQALNLRQWAVIGRTYTYLGINYEKIFNSIYPDTDDKIPLLSMRFAVTNMAEAQSSLKTTKGILGSEQAFDVTGVDDIVINYYDLNVWKLIKLFKLWYNPEGTEIDNLLSTFNEITTRVGIQHIVNTYEYDENNNNLLSLECNELIRNTMKLRTYDNLCFGEAGWIKPFIEIAKSLDRMSKTSLLDEFVYLLLPGISSFLANINYSIENHSYLSIENENETYSELVEECSHLMEQIMRVEGQLSNRPELRPIVYDIPIFVLEYTLAFLNTTVNLLQNKDTAITPIQFLIIPRLCEKISCQEIFQASQKNQLSGLVLLNIPIQLLYKPELVISALCHETAHFAGEYSRHRDYRKKKFICAAAVLIAHKYYVSCDSCLINEIETELIEYLANKDCTRIDAMYEHIIVYAHNLAVSNYSYNGIVWKAYSAYKRNKQATTERLRMLSAKELARAKVTFESTLNDLRILFREVYADLCMMQILDLNSEQYIRYLIEESYGNNSEIQSKYVVQFAIRVYVVLRTRGDLKKNASITVKTQYRKTWDHACRIMQAIDKEITTGLVGVNKYPIPTSSVLALIEYAEKCRRSLKDGLGIENVKKAREIYENSKNGINDYEKALKQIGESRVQKLY